MFGGHSHDDQLKVLWDVNNNARPVAVTYLAPSINSNGKKSPSFRLYELDGGYPEATWVCMFCNYSVIVCVVSLILQNFTHMYTWLLIFTEITIKSVKDLI